MLIGDDDVCDFCFSGDCDSDDPIIYCDSCNACVHASCYQITGDLPESFICEACEAHDRQCCLCYNSSPFMMQQIKFSSLYAHALCFRFAPTLNFEFYQRLSCGTSQEVVENKIQSNISEIKCSICGYNGNVRDCCTSYCKQCFHPSCCIQSGGKLLIRETDTHEFLQLLCADHSKSDNFYIEIWPGIEKLLYKNYDFPIDFNEENCGNLIMNVNCCESEETFQESIKMFGINALRQYSRLLNFQQNSMLKVQKIWQIVKKRRVRDPVEVGCIFNQSIDQKVQTISFCYLGNKIQLQVISQLMSDDIDFNEKNVNFTFTQIITENDLTKLYVQGLFLIGILEVNKFESIFGFLLQKEQQNLYTNCYFCVFDLGYYLQELAGQLGIFGIQLTTFLDDKLYSYI
ncbi:PHD-finger domain-containing protein [Spironucleus salmonicida]|uniref:PHD-finger domain-containing protein n=1 Tax=Spironucleus salmonicida TaxID=348837 RepID=V6LM41_9EUKA|nr:PHD-finger domain-containing protein [Spironucleus salmonicida]|eukprot:EST45757.1 PHD-finger domain-containing protein [Spironucleus salmonicida]